MGQPLLQHGDGDAGGDAGGDDIADDATSAVAVAAQSQLEALQAQLGELEAEGEDPRNTTLWCERQRTQMLANHHANLAAFESQAQALAKQRASTAPVSTRLNTLVP